MKNSNSDNGFSQPISNSLKRIVRPFHIGLYNNRLNNNGYNYQGTIQQEVEPGYTDGYGSTSPEVIIPAFLAAYTKKDPREGTLETFPGYL